MAQLAQMLSAQNAAEVPPTKKHRRRLRHIHSSPRRRAAEVRYRISSLLGGLDMNTIARFLPLLQEMNAAVMTKAPSCCMPSTLLKPERQSKVDSALRLARLFRVGKSIFKGLGEQHV